MTFSDISLLLAQVTPPVITDSSEQTYVTEINPAIPAAFGLFSLVFAIFIIASVWKVFSKAGKPGWAVLVPIYNIIVLLQIVGRPGWWFLLLIIPGVNIIIGILLALDLAKSYGKGAGFAMGLIFLGFIFYPILGFGSAQYQGPAAAQA